MPLFPNALNRLRDGLRPRPFKRSVFVATRPQGLGQSSTGLSANTISSLESRLRVYGGYNGGTNVRLLFPSYYLTPNYTLAPNAFTLRAAIEQAAANAPATFAGAASRTVNPSDLIVASDVVVAGVAAGETLYVRTGTAFASGQQVPTGFLRFPSGNTIESIPGTSSGASQVGGTGVMSVTSPYSAQGFAYGPIGVIGEVGRYTAAVAILGDSIFDGTTNPTGDGAGNVGFPACALHGERIGFSKATRGSNRAEFATPSAAPGQFLLLQYATHCLCDLGTNDLMQTATASPLATIKANLLAIWAAAKAQGCKVHQMLIFPRTSGDFTSEAGQTPLTRFAVGGDRDLLNAWIRARVADGTIDGCLDLLSLVESAATPGVWQPNKTADGTHPTDAQHAALVTPMASYVRSWKFAN